MNIQIHEIEPKDAWPIRQPVLRPHGTLDDCVYAGDDDSSTRHFGAYTDQRLIGIVSIYERAHSEINGSGFQIRAMATLPQARGLGAGAKLLDKAEAYAFESGADYVWANSRVSAKGFYLKSAYLIQGGEYHIESIGPHLLMYKFSTGA